MNTMTEDQKTDLIEKYRDINTDYEWWDCVYERFKEDMEKVGIHVAEMSFSGFWSQGDGASFTGYIDDNKRFFEHHKLDESYPMTMKLLRLGGGFSLTVERNSHHYAHENTVSVCLSYADDFNTLGNRYEDAFRASVIDLFNDKLEAEYDTICSAATEIIRGYCRDLYQQLEDQYDYLTSDEAVWDTIMANELGEVEEEEEEEEV